MAGNNNNNDFDGVGIVTPDAVQDLAGGITAGDLIAQGRTIEQIRSKYHTAVRVQVARNLDEVKKRCLQEAKHGGDEFGWAWPVSVPDKDEDGNIKKDERGKWIMKEEIIDGRSINLAMAAVRNWGNCTTELYVTADLPDRYEVLGVFVDFESGFTNMRPYTQRKAARDLSDKQKKKASQIARQDDMTLQIALSKCIRNVILSSLPSWLTDEMYEESKKWAKSRIKERLAESIEKIIFVVGKYGVSLAQMEMVAEKECAAWDENDVVRFRALVQSIRDGQVSVADAFPAVNETSTPPQAAVPAQATQTPDTPPPAETTAPASNGTELSAELGNALEEISMILNELAGTDAAKRKAYMTNWSGAKIATFTSLKSYPDLIPTVLDRARIVKDEVSEAKQEAAKNQQKGKLL